MRRIGIKFGSPWWPSMKVAFKGVWNTPYVALSEAAPHLGAVGLGLAGIAFGLLMTVYTVVMSFGVGAVMFVLGLLGALNPPRSKS